MKVPQRESEVEAMDYKLIEDFRRDDLGISNL